MIYHGPPLSQICIINKRYSTEAFQTSQLVLLVAFGAVHEPLIPSDDSNSTFDNSTINCGIKFANGKHFVSDWQLKFSHHKSQDWTECYICHKSKGLSCSIESLSCKLCPHVYIFNRNVTHLAYWSQLSSNERYTNRIQGDTRMDYLCLPARNSISQEICTRFCCAMLCCGYAIVHNEFTWSIYPYSSGLLRWHWGNR